MTSPSVSAPSRQFSHPDRNSQHHQNPDGRPDQRNPLHTEQIRDGELDSDRKHQQNDADFGKHLEGMQIRNMRPRRERADRDPAQHESQDQRQSEPPSHQPPDHRSQEDVSQIAKQYRVRFHSPYILSYLARNSKLIFGRPLHPIR